MSDQWLCLIDGQKLGPLKFARLQQLAETGRLKPDDYVRPASDEQWKVAKDIPNLIHSPAVTAESSGGKKRRNSGPLPVAQAIIEPAVAVSEIPRGKTVATPPPVESPPQPVDSEMPFFVSDTNAGESGVVLLRGRKRKSNGVMPLMIGGIAVVGVLATLLVLVLSGVIDLSGAATPVANADSENKVMPPVEADEVNEEEANPTDSEKTTQAEAAPSKASGKKHPLLSSVTQFLDVTKRYRSSGRLAVQVSVTGLWLSVDEKGEPYVGAAKEDAAQDPKFLVVELKIDNAAGAAPTKYQGWRGKAVLFDDAGEPIEPLAPEQVAVQPLEPGGSLAETLVFPLANVEFEKLRLVLPHESVGIKDNRSFGLELPRHALGRGLETPLADTPAAPVNAQVNGDIPPLEIIDKDPAPMPPKATPAKPKDDLEELLKKLDAKAKERDEMEKKK